MSINIILRSPIETAKGRLAHLQRLYGLCCVLMMINAFGADVSL